MTLIMSSLLELEWSSSLKMYAKGIDIAIYLINNTLNSRNLCAIKHIQYSFSPLNYHQ